MSKVIVLDVDDTVLYWTPHFIEWLFNNKLSKLNTHSPDTWFSDEYVAEYNQTTGFSFRIRIPEICGILESLIPGTDTDVVFISACGKGNYLRQQRALQTAFFHFPWILHTVDNSYDKIEILLNLQKQYDKLLFIDDKHSTIDIANRAGIPSIAPHSYENRFRIADFLHDDFHMGI